MIKNYQIKFLCCYHRINSVYVVFPELLYCFLGIIMQRK